MEKYEMMEVVGEGSYGVVMKCRHRETGQFVAIKRFLETEEDLQVRKMAFREIRMLKKLRHENLVNMIEVFRRKKRFYLVFEYLDHTLLDELERFGGSLGYEISKRHIYQVLRGLNFCHANNIMHRDIKPENVLVSPNGVIKLCDFGFARLVSGPNESCTDYVATRWYRSPELLVGDPRYGKAVDVWATGCLYAEMMTGNPLFPGDSDVDQLYRITKVLGGLCNKHQAMMGHNGPGRMLRLTSADELVGPPQSGLASVRRMFPLWDPLTTDFLAQCLRMDPELRPKCSTLLNHTLFTRNGFADRFLDELQLHVAKESAMNPLVGKRSEERRLSILLAESPTRTCRKSTGRWQITMIKDKSNSDKVPSEQIETVETHRPPPIQITRPREVCYFGPVSVAPNTTYIRRLEQKGLLTAGSKGCTLLPSLASKDQSKASTAGKRKRIDFPSVDR
ncbi:cyclin-dependent kinase-like 4 [Hylaeus anthracinus]|uniref:cyclin-dependent kinase-like 4 n=1 Tax=Hylaeus anthracinus TaxID=313031 RepID=UPI0023BA038E|nr:cyclin-dependent kinase-like 4 [Hylaeus anthracinus]XP_054008399.1 cyclin-dependent kinase-like 4 [Hylaeus anthracinus]XP_054008400.1 cyclin-dependent kinase-like 4 [Hylaeus anthracinus]XP_054008401.1 cyclin-dependent kinase-like 4 [Hylaeus anthracinus]XP_054008402.1 cyclin-dependent kinase-like 4 [Hylaeus anthracinus]XP_054008403.1 cyclin-dependent kinase-like 4 [Hylaeus anthracinus]